MDDNDPIQLLLKSTGWTPQDLLKRLEKYKPISKTEDDKNDLTEPSSSENIVPLISNDNIVDGYKSTQDPKQEQEGIDEELNATILNTTCTSVKLTDNRDSGQRNETSIKEVSTFISGDTAYNSVLIGKIDNKEHILKCKAKQEEDHIGIVRSQAEPSTKSSHEDITETCSEPEVLRNKSSSVRIRSDTIFNSNSSGTQNESSVAVRDKKIAGSSSEQKEETAKAQMMKETVLLSSSVKQSEKICKSPDIGYSLMPSSCVGILNNLQHENKKNDLVGVADETCKQEAKLSQELTTEDHFILSNSSSCSEKLNKILNGNINCDKSYLKVTSKREEDQFNTLSSENGNSCEKVVNESSQQESKVPESASLEALNPSITSSSCVEDVLESIEEIPFIINKCQIQTELPIEIICKENSKKKLGGKETIPGTLNHPNSLGKGNEDNVLVGITDQTAASEIEDDVALSNSSACVVNVFRDSGNKCPEHIEKPYKMPELAAHCVLSSSPVKSTDYGSSKKEGKSFNAPKINDNLVISRSNSCVEIDSEGNVLISHIDKSSKPQTTVLEEQEILVLSSSSSCVEVLNDSQNENVEILQKVNVDIAKTASFQSIPGASPPAHFSSDEDYSSDNTSSEIAKMDDDDDDDEDDYFEETCASLPNFKSDNTSSEPNFELGNQGGSDESNFSEENFVIKLNSDTDKEIVVENKTNDFESKPQTICISDNSDLEEKKADMQNFKTDNTLSDEKDYDSSHANKINLNDEDIVKNGDEDKITVCQKTLSQTCQRLEVDGKKPHVSVQEEKMCNTRNNFEEVISRANATYEEEEDDEYNQEEPIQTPEKLEEIRNNLKMQLSCLRTRKKPNVLKELLAKVANDANDVEKHIDVNIISSMLIETPETKTTAVSPLVTMTPKMKCNVSSRAENSLNETSDISTERTESVISSVTNMEAADESSESDSFGLVISCVQGGVDDIDSFITGSSVSKSNTDISDSLTTNTNLIQNSKTVECFVNNDTDAEQLSEHSSSCFQPTEDDAKESEEPSVLKDLRKIIHKQKTNDNLINKSNRIGKRDIKEFCIFSDGSHSEHRQEVGKSSTSLEPLNNMSDNSVSNTDSFVESNNSSKMDSQSPFVSNTLDEFLTENSKLNISYKLPKLDAEEGIKSDTYNEDSLLIIKKIQEAEERFAGSQRKKNLSSPKIKAKTLAEKRKLLEKSKTREEKKLEKHKKQMDQQRSYVLFHNKKVWVRSRVPGKYLGNFSNTQSRGSRYPKLIEPKKTNIDKPLEKPSLLKDLFKQTRCKMKYKPGPLSKKKLTSANNNNNKWQTAIKRMPKVVLEIKPEIGKPINPKIMHLLPKNDGHITDSLIDFALSVLTTKTESAKAKPEQDQTEVFRICVPYRNNLEKIIVRKRRTDLLSQCLNTSNIEKNKVFTDEEQVTNILHDLMRYVEIKELAPSLIIDCTNDKFETETKLDFKPTKISENVSAIVKKPITKRSRIDIELQRLSCKIVNVKVDTSNEDNNCEKAYCQLGCVCRSLSCETFIGNHCKKLECMFYCSCQKKPDIVYDKELQFPAGTDILTRDTVSRIEKQAKRDLAKVEREFTQTVICTDDKTIVVGIGGRSKSKRATKVPKKYNDFFSADEAIAESIGKQNQKDPKLSSQCLVKLEKVDLSSVIPYCLVHRLYYCHCRGLAAYKKEDVKPTTSKSVKEESNKSNQMDANNSELKILEDEVIYSVTGRPMRNPNKIKKNYSVLDDALEKTVKKVNKRVSEASESDNIVSFEDAERGCARSRENQPEKISRGPICNRVCNKTFEKEDYIFNLTEADLFKVKLLSKSGENEELTESDRLKIILISDYRRALSAKSTLESPKKNTLTSLPPSPSIVKTIEDLSPESERKNKRKQKLQVRHDIEGFVKIGISDSLAIQRRKKKSKSVFVGEIIVTDPEWLQKLEANSKQMLYGYARLLPWKSLMSGFYSGDIRIYCAIDYPYRLVFTKVGNDVPVSYLNIAEHGPDIVYGPLKIKTEQEHILRQTQQVRSVISWIISSGLPKKYMAGILSFLLIEAKKDQFEVRGLCNQILNNREEEGEQIEPLINEKCKQTEDNVVEMVDKNYKQTEDNIIEMVDERHKQTQDNIFETVDEKQKQTQDNIVEIKHRDMHNKTQTMYIRKQVFDILEIIGEPQENLEKNICKVNLPHIFKKCKWRMLNLNREFAYILFQKIHYSIKYTDLDNLSKRATAEKCTIILKNTEISEAYSHKDFGLYFDPNYSDRIFIGPYFKEHTDEDVKTLRYFNKTLVNSETFSKMQGRVDYKCGQWMVEARKDENMQLALNINPTATVDLTEDDELTDVVEGNPLKRKSEDEPDIPLPKRLSLRHELAVKNDTVKSVPDTTCEHIIYHENQPILIKSSQGRTPNEYNKYIITNIPGFGYLGAFKSLKQPAIEVSWPYEKKVLHFNTCEHAKSFLQYRFTQLLLPIPETFVINITILDELNVKCTNPINAEFLTGFSICGKFGTINYKSLTETVCRDVLGLTLEQVTSMFARRAQAAVRKQIEELATVLDLDKSTAGSYNITNILNVAVNEIKKLEQAEKQFRSDIKRKELHVVSRIKKLYQMISELPASERNMESKIFNETLRIREYKPTVEDEVIEITESDDEEPVDSTSSKTAPIELKILGHVSEAAGSSTLNPIPWKLGPDKPTSPKVAKVAPFSSSKKTIIISNYKSILKKQNVPLSSQIINSSVASHSGHNPVPLQSTPNSKVPLQSQPVSRPITLKDLLDNTGTPTYTKTVQDQPSGTTLKFTKIVPKPELLNLAECAQSDNNGGKGPSGKGYKLVKVANGSVVLMPKT